MSPSSWQIEKIRRQLEISQTWGLAVDIDKSKSHRIERHGVFNDGHFLQWLYFSGRAYHQKGREAKALFDEAIASNACCMRCRSANYSFLEHAPDVMSLNKALECGADVREVPRAMHKLINDHSLHYSWVDREHHIDSLEQILIRAKQHKGVDNRLLRRCIGKFVKMEMKRNYDDDLIEIDFSLSSLRTLDCLLRCDVWQEEMGGLVHRQVQEIRRSDNRHIMMSPRLIMAERLLTSYEQLQSDRRGMRSFLSMFAFKSAPRVARKCGLALRISSHPLFDIQLMRCISRAAVVKIFPMNWEQFGE